MWQFVSTLGHWITQPASHSAVGFGAGSLGSLLTSIMCYALYRWASPSYRSRAGTVARYGIVILVLLVGLSVGLLSHAYLDGLSTWLTTPLNPPMVILK